MPQLIAAVVLAAAIVQAQAPAAMAHLQTASGMLEQIPRDKLDEEDADERFEGLVRAFDEMKQSYSLSLTDPAQRLAWQNRFSTVERQLTALVGGGRAFEGPIEAAAATPVSRRAGAAGNTADAAGNVGTAGSAGTAATAGSADSGATPAPTGTSGAATGGDLGIVTAGVAVEVSTIGIEGLDPVVRDQLHAFRRELELFFLAALR